MLIKNRVSPSRTYVVPVKNYIEDGYCFRKFTLPEGEGIVNNSEFASYYYLNYLDSTSVVGEIYTFEDYSNLVEAQEP